MRGAVVGSLTFGIDLRLMCLCLRSGQAHTADKKTKQNRQDLREVDRRLGNMHSGQSPVAQLKSYCCLHQMYLPSHCIAHNNKCKCTLLYPDSSQLCAMHLIYPLFHTSHSSLTRLHQFGPQEPRSGISDQSII